MRRKPKGSCYDCGEEFHKYSTWVLCNLCTRGKKKEKKPKFSIQERRDIMKLKSKEWLKKYPKWGIYDYYGGRAKIKSEIEKEWNDLNKSKI
jgi:ribosomal protein S27E